MKIAVELSDSRTIKNVNNTNDEGAEKQSIVSGWTLAESDSAFSIDTMYEWTVRESDNKLVHISTGLTPDEENKSSLVELTKEQLKDNLTKDQLQNGLTTLSKQYIEDKANSRMVTTELTKQIADLTVKLNKANGVDSAPKVPTDITSTATNDGAVITAK